MILFRQIIVYLIMICALIGCLSLILNEKSELGKEFLAGVDSIGPIFLPVAGIMASMHILTKIVGDIFGPIFGIVGADPAMAATTFIAVDMGGYQLAQALSKTNEGWMMAMMTGYMAGATIVFTIPVALKIIEKKDRKYLALGVMSGLLAIPIGILGFAIMLTISNPTIREFISTNSEATYQLLISWTTIFMNLTPIIIICVLLSLGLKYKPDKMISGFNYFGKILDIFLKLVFVLVIIEYFTEIPSKLLGLLQIDIFF